MEFNAQTNSTVFLVETDAYEGVKRIAAKVAHDVKRVCAVVPEIIDHLPSLDKPEESSVELAKSCQKHAGLCKQASTQNRLAPNIIFFATLGKSSLTDRLIREGKFDPSKIQGKREVYQIKQLENPFPECSQLLLICGSDKRGTIYGMFGLSEFIGVSPLHFWGDAEPTQRDYIEITTEIETVSKEPSVKYRGFFINDEWPCFGSWTDSHFGGFTAKMYDHVFELLLRLKGNYMWPAMWRSSFGLDGPDNLNEELADIYGVIMGASHHEPCLRASEEWDKVRGAQSRYGNEWNYYTNREGLLRYWEDALLRSGKYEHIITIGMRGERDSSMLGDNSTLKDNIELLKDIIVNQRILIKRHVDGGISKTPQLLALYKEVEQFFYGGDDAPGLKDWNELDDVILMLCEDNFGFIRTLPTEEIQNRKGGFGMYYHFDYHGNPISYEWMPSTPYSKVWEQMCMAYDYGIRDVWIVNVGDLKFNEVPLTYFMDLAYDFEKWGSGSLNSWREYIDLWTKKTFPETCDLIRRKIAAVLEQYIHINGMRRPESLNAGIYHACHYLEADRMLDMAAETENLNEEIYNNLEGNEKDAYYSMIYFPAKCSVNLLHMHLYSGKNAHYAAQGKTVANIYAAHVTKCIETDRRLMEEFAAFKDGKWKGMELESHIGFTKWNDDNYRYPLRTLVEPAHKPRMTVSRKDSEKIAVRNYGRPMTIEVYDFLYEGNTEVILEIANDGIGSLEYTIEIEENSGCDYSKWLSVSPMKASVETQEEVLLRCDREKLTDKVQTANLIIKDEETTVIVIVKGKAVNKDNLPEKTFLENNGIITIAANHYCHIHNAPNAAFLELESYGRNGCGMKVFPTTVDFSPSDDKPTLTYRFLAEHTGDYEAEIWITPTNSVKHMRPLRFMLSGSEGATQILEAIGADFKAGDSKDAAWRDGVLRQIRIIKTEISVEKGICEITIGALEAGLILERILIYQKGQPPKASYLGPLESFYSL